MLALYEYFIKKKKVLWLSDSNLYELFFLKQKLLIIRELIIKNDLIKKIYKIDCSDKYDIWIKVLRRSTI